MSELDDFFDDPIVPGGSSAPAASPMDKLQAAADILKDVERWTDGAARADIGRARARIEKMLEDST